MLYPVSVNKLKEQWTKDFVQSMCMEHEKLSKKFNNRKFKIISIYQVLEYNKNNQDEKDYYSLKVEYKCKILKTFYFKWKFWKTYKFKNFLKSL